MKKIAVLGALLLMIVSCKKQDQEHYDDVNNSSPQHIDSTYRIDSLKMARANDSLQLVKQDSIALVKKDSIENAKRIAFEKSKNAKKFQVFKGDTFSYWPIKNSDSLRNLFYKTFSKEQQYTIAALNRIDTDHINKRDTLIVPNEFKNAFIDYSPFPSSLQNVQQIPKLIIFSYPIQAYGVYEHGTLVKWGPTNMGKQSAQTPRGLFFTNWKGRKVKSTVDDEWILNWNFNIHNTDGVGWHQYALPGYPASHSCLRLLDADAQWLYNWADQWVLADQKTVKVKGTPVIVFGDYTFGVKGIWHQLVQNSTITNISQTDLEAIVEPYIAEILNQQAIREDYNKSKGLPTTQTDSLSID